MNENELVPLTWSIGFGVFFSPSLLFIISLCRRNFPHFETVLNENKLCSDGFKRPIEQRIRPKKERERASLPKSILRFLASAKKRAIHEWENKAHHEKTTECWWRRNAKFVARHAIYTMCFFFCEIENLANGKHSTFDDWCLSHCQNRIRKCLNLEHSRLA